MSLLYDPDTKKPQPWAYIFFIGMTIFLVAAVFFFGLRRADQLQVGSSNVENMFEGVAN